MVARVVAVISLTLACHPNNSDGDQGDDTGDTGDLELLQPAFLNPAVGEFAIDSVRHVPLDIVVDAITLGNTQLVLDGQTVGDLSPGSPLGELTGERLRLFLYGALALGAHTLQLSTSTPEGPLVSAPLTMLIQAPGLPSLTYRALLLEDPVAQGHALTTGPGGALALLATGAEPRLRVFLPLQDTWSSALAAEIPLEGHVLEPMAFGPTFAVQVTPAGLRVAHRRGLPGDAIITRDLRDLVPFEPQVAFDLSDPLFASHEVATIGAPALIGDALVAEFTAATDSELSHPGDRGLVHLRWREGAWTRAQRVATAEPTDLDALGPLLRLSDLDHTRRPSLALRVGRRLPGVLALTEAGSAQVSLAPDRLDLPAGDPGVVTLLASNFDAHTVLGLTPGAFNFGVYSGTDDTPTLAATTDLPPVPLSAPPALGVILGYSVFLLPFGDAAPVHLLSSDSKRIFVQPLEQPTPLHCDALALFPGLGGNNPEDPALTLACLHHGTLRYGLLSREP